MPLPIEIVGLNRPDLTIHWDETSQSTYKARDLRLSCRCAHCIEEMTGRPLLDPHTVPDVITITNLDLVGTYGIQIRFSDGHGTGIFRFEDLYRRWYSSRSP